MLSVFGFEMFAITGGSSAGGSVDEGEDGGHKDKCGYSCASQAADDGTAERSILLTAIASAECHWHHADNHCESGHDDGTEARRAGFEGGADRVAVLFKAALGERDDEDAVRRGNAHTHDGSHQRRHAEASAREEEEDYDSGERGGKRGDDDEGVDPALEVNDDQ